MKHLASLTAVFCLSLTAQAAVVITFEQVGNDVVATATGTLEEPSSTLGPSGGAVGASIGSAFAAVGSTSAFKTYTSVGGFVTGSWSGPGSNVAADSSTGPRVGFNANSAILLGAETPFGASISSTATWESTTLQALSLDVSDDMTRTYSSVSGQDTIRMYVVVPEPSGAILALAGLGLAISRRGR